MKSQRGTRPGPPSELQPSRDPSLRRRRRSKAPIVIQICIRVSSPRGESTLSITAFDVTLHLDGAGPVAWPSSTSLQGQVSARRRDFGGGEEASSIPYTIQGLEPTMILPQVHLR